ncbi:hypothetical protein N8198_02940 [Gammaproteobacteria bacterium]|nr:hypothetical protein [Gammaproteobacteria bacterium]
MHPISKTPDETQGYATPEVMVRIGSIMGIEAARQRLELDPLQALAEVDLISGCSTTLVNLFPGMTSGYR